ncbi:hypothetical protein BW730_06250 [Tessaracoccus aquimaris]|uniref:LarA-like N-terminal domain-containing protein n=1 Tax=Tessaracoccus aquimaris TaxID=1332264 RepID=A0A1Q2CM26_9ACTN|nr:hypothetical protein BW730_06250 [Tessaracoccus aquimaris]
MLEVDEKTPHLMTMSGAQLRLERFGIGTQVVYAADAEESSDPVGLIDAAVGAPTGVAPLSEQLRPDTRLTLVIVDADAPLPRPHFDPRRTLAERVLEIAARNGVDDVEIVVANGLKQRWNTQQVTRVLGDRVATSFLPDGLITSHDVTSPDLVSVGEVDGTTVRVNRRVAQSDLVVVIGIRGDDSERCPLALGLTDLTTLDRIGGVAPDREFERGVSDLIQEKVPGFALLAVLGQPLLAPGFASCRAANGNGASATGWRSPRPGRSSRRFPVRVPNWSTATPVPTTRSSTWSVVPSPRR